MAACRGDPTAADSTYTIFNTSHSTWPIWAVLPATLQTYKPWYDSPVTYATWFHPAKDVYHAIAYTMPEFSRGLRVESMGRVTDSRREVIKEQEPIFLVFGGEIYIAYVVVDGHFAVRKIFNPVTGGEFIGDATYHEWDFESDASDPSVAVYEDELRMFVVDSVHYGTLYYKHSSSPTANWTEAEKVTTMGFSPRRVMTAGNGAKTLYVLVTDEDENVHIAEFTNKFTETDPAWHRVHARSRDGAVAFVGASLAGESKILLVWREAGYPTDKNARLYESYLDV